MKFLMVSNAGEGAHILKMVQNEGNDVQLYIKEPGYRGVWDGLLPKAKKIAPDKDTVVIFDFSGFGTLADKLKASGIPVVGASKFADKMEHDRQFGLDLMAKCGIKTPLTQEFTKFDKIEEFLRANERNEKKDEDRRFVFKPSGKNLPAHLTYCSLDSTDLLEYAEYVEKNYGKDIDSFILQEFICGVVVSTEAWCDGKQFIRPANHTLEVKALMNDDKGPATGCSGNLVWIEDGMCRIVASGVARVEKEVVEAGHVGPIDLNAVVNDDGVYGLEWTPRFGYDATPTQMFLFKDSIAKFFSDIARGTIDYDMPLNDKFAAGVRFTIPPYPLEPEKVEDVQKVRPNVGIPIRGLTEKNSGKFYFYEVAEEDGKLLHAAGTGVLGVAVGVADNPWRAFDTPCEALCDLLVPELQYRTDLRYKLGDMYESVEYQDGVSTTLGAIPELELEESGR